jgi:hypothetical protein
MVPLPKRRGPALSLAPGDAGQRPPTLTDALNVMGLCAVGDPAVTRSSYEANCPSAAEVPAGQAVRSALDRLAAEVSLFVDRINRQPVYTVSAFLVDWRLAPGRAVILGGPAETLAPLAGEALGLPARAPSGAATANALGAALARPTWEAELYADTDHGVMSVPTLGRRPQINISYRQARAEAELLELMGGDPEVRITSSECFSQFHEYGRAGRVIRVTAQSAPGLIARLNDGGPSKLLT